MIMQKLFQFTKFEMEV